MKKLRKQIKESFFNPILHLLPLLLFLVLDELYGIPTAWKISFPVVLISVLYVYFVYNKIFTWHLIFTFMFLVISIIASVEYFIPVPGLFKQLVYELVAFSFLAALIFFRKWIQKKISGMLSKLVPMSNNLDEMYKVIWALFVLLGVYISAYFILQKTIRTNVLLYIKFLRYVYVSGIIFMIVYEIVRVQIIRTKLLGEEWWPIVNKNGKIIGSIQHLTSLNDENKYMHPIIRVMLIDKGRVLLQKRTANSHIFPGLWDTSISNHVKMTETIEKCVERTAFERYSLQNFKYVFLSNYILETANEYHYAILFVSCQQMDMQLNPTFVEQTKWWTQQQIEENLNTGIFSENLKIEYDLVKRSGLLESGKCECSCRLKETIYQQPRIIN